MKKKSGLGLGVLLCFTTAANAAPLRSWNQSPTQRADDRYVFQDQKGSPWRLILGADGGYIKYGSLNTSLEGSRSGFSLGGRALIAYYWWSVVAEGGLGGAYLSAKGTNPTGTTDTISTKIPFLDFSIRYRLGRYLQFGPEFQYSLGTDFGLNDNIVSGSTNHGAFIGAQVAHEWERERKFRLGARWLTPISGTNRSVTQVQAFFQMAFDLPTISGREKSRSFEEINEYDIERAQERAPKRPLPMATPTPPQDPQAGELEQLPIATPAPPEAEPSAPAPGSSGSNSEIPASAVSAESVPAPVGAGTEVKLVLGINDLPFGVTDAKLPRTHISRLKNMGKYLGDHSDEFRKLVITGHTDERGSKPKNAELSKERAEVVREFLIEGGAPPEKIIAEGKGESVPLDPRHNEKAWAKNRRVELRFNGVGNEATIKKALDQ
jgi:outer membrane protein OmpA-like peptidoglycan-associated protein